MKNVVIYDYFRESEIRPALLQKEYIAKVQEDIALFFPDDAQFVETSCPACGSSQYNRSFRKFNRFTYRSCAQCDSIYVSPRPSRIQLDDFYSKAGSVRFWRSRLLAETKDTRWEPQFVGRQQWVEDACSFYNVSSANVIEAFDVLDGAYDPQAYLKDCRRKLAAGGLLFLSSTSSVGMDIQVLWEHAQRISPPDHLNLFSPEGIEGCLERNGFELLELSTPGQLDVDILLNYLRNEPDAQVPSFIRYLLTKRGEDAHQALQEFLQHYRLSSFLRVVARRRT